MVLYPPMPAAPSAPSFDVVNAYAFNLKTLPQETHCKWYQSSKVHAVAAPIFAILASASAVGCVYSAVFLVAMPETIIVAVFGLAFISIVLTVGYLVVSRLSPDSTDPDYRLSVREKIINAFRNWGFERIALDFRSREFEQLGCRKLDWSSVISSEDVNFLLTNDVQTLSFDQFHDKHGVDAFKCLNAANLSRIKEKFMHWMEGVLSEESHDREQLLQLARECHLLVDQTDIDRCITKIALHQPEMRYSEFIDLCEGIEQLPLLVNAEEAHIVWKLFVDYADSDQINLGASDVYDRCLDFFKAFSQIPGASLIYQDQIGRLQQQLSLSGIKKCLEGKWSLDELLEHNSFEWIKFHKEHEALRPLLLKLSINQLFSDKLTLIRQHFQLTSQEIEGMILNEEGMSVKSFDSIIKTLSSIGFTEELIRDIRNKLFKSQLERCLDGRINYMTFSCGNPIELAEPSQRPLLRVSLLGLPYKQLVSSLLISDRAFFDIDQNEIKATLQKRWESISFKNLSNPYFKELFESIGKEFQPSEWTQKALDDTKDLTINEMLAHHEALLKYNILSVSHFREKLEKELSAKPMTWEGCVSHYSPVIFSQGLFKGIPQFEEMALSYIQRHIRACVENKEDGCMQLIFQWKIVPEELQDSVEQSKVAHAHNKMLFEQAVALIKANTETKKSDLKSAKEAEIERGRADFQINLLTRRYEFAIQEHRRHKAIETSICSQIDEKRRDLAESKARMRETKRNVDRWQQELSVAPPSPYEIREIEDSIVILEEIIRREALELKIKSLSSEIASMREETGVLRENASKPPEPVRGLYGALISSPQQLYMKHQEKITALESELRQCQSDLSMSKFLSKTPKSESNIDDLRRKLAMLQTQKSQFEEARVNLVEGSASLSHFLTEIYESKRAIDALEHKLKHEKDLLENAASEVNEAKVSLNQSERNFADLAKRLERECIISCEELNQEMGKKILLEKQKLEDETLCIEKALMAIFESRSV